MIYLLIIPLAILIRIIFYIERELYLTQFKDEWFEFQSKKNDDDSIGKKLHLGAYKMKKYMRQAGYGKIHSPYPRNVGLGMMVKGVDVLENWSMGDRDVVELLARHFWEAIGYYKTKKWESINPLYWIELIIFLPKNILKYLGIKKQENIWIHLIQIIYWVLAIYLAIIQIIK